MRTYQLSLVLSGKASEAEQKKVLDKVERNVESAGGKIEKNDKVGKKTLAYPIKKEKVGVYYFLDIEVPEEEMQALNRAIEVDDNVLRHLLVMVTA
ncbi:MAG: 30S ribosomal protein S6 [bacterium]|nr:30S ribosomal protein S6 [bacterium]